jgi:transposase
MPIAKEFAPAYNVQTAVDAEHALIVAHRVTDKAGDNTHLQPMAEGAKQALCNPESLNVVADADYSNGEQAQACEAQGIAPHVPVIRAANNRGDGTLFDRSEFHYDEESDTFCCPAKQTLTRQQVSRKDCAVVYAASTQVCGACALKHRCTSSSRRLVQRHLYEGALQRMRQRATPEMMRLRRSTVEHPFASLKYQLADLARIDPSGLTHASDPGQDRIDIGAGVAAIGRFTLEFAGGGKMVVAVQTAV